MNTLSDQKKTLILQCLVEGMSIRATARLVDVSKNTVAKLLRDAGKVCAAFQHDVLRGLSCNRVEVDEIWSFVYAKAKNVARVKNAPPEAGDVWTWVAIDADTKLVPTWRIANRTGMTAIDLMDDLRSRIENRVQLTTDGHTIYLEAVEGTFGDDVDYAQLVKIYGNAESIRSPDTLYSPAEDIDVTKVRVEGDPDMGKASTSQVERQNLTMRTSMRRFTRLTNAFSKKLENLGHAVALHFMHHNFCRIHQSLRATPAMVAGVVDDIWEVSDIVDLVEWVAPKPKRPATYKKRAAKSAISN